MVAEEEVLDARPKCVDWKVMRWAWEWAWQTPRVESKGRVACACGVEGKRVASWVGRRNVVAAVVRWVGVGDVREQEGENEVTSQSNLKDWVAVVRREVQKMATAGEVDASGDGVG